MNQSMLRYGSIAFISLFAFFIVGGRDVLDTVAKSCVPEVKVHSERMPLTRTDIDEMSRGRGKSKHVERILVERGSLE